MEIPIIHWGLELALSFLGLWPNKRNYLIPQLLLCSSIFVISPFQLQDILVNKNKGQMFDVIRDMIVIIFLVLKFLILFFNKGNLHSLLMDLDKDWKAMKNSKDEAIMMKYVKYAQKFCFFEWSLYSFTTFAYFTEFFILYLTNSSDQRILLIPAKYPFDINPLPVFIVATLFQCALFVCWTCANSLSETLLGTLVFHLVGKIEILQNGIRNISFPKHSTENRYLIIYIKTIANEHRKLLRMSEKMEMIYSYICLSQILESTISLCLSSSIPQSICDCSWYEASPENIKLLLIIIMRTQHPITLTVGKFTELSIKSFAKGCHATLKPREPRNVREFYKP
ncbi:uncharacterized protein LOC122500765 [Leptopilina heterotoma]|uniref:uncharacterized protein LOC122500765 n=1 Tax=Leptopilina heterotoma TaxID=63436 RepID=UPI001CA88BC8|nr:uncharacterized protein LOC122500765 [Leptopilina heterotoma]